MQLLIYQAPISSLLLSGIALVLETPWLDGGILEKIDQSMVSREFPIDFS